MNYENYTIADFYKTDDFDLFAKAGKFSEFLTDWKNKGTYSYHRTLASGCKNRTIIRDPGTGKTHEMIVLSSNNYLGLNFREEVKQASLRALEKYGSGMSGSRFLSGTYELVVQLEQELAEFEHCEESVVFTSGYQANVGTISAIMRPHDVAIIDRFAHASIVDGCRLSGCILRTFKHNDMNSLEKVLKKCAAQSAGLLVAVDGIFSMDGDLAPLPEIVALAKQYGARVLVDEAHATGVLGSGGRGTVEHFGLQGQVDIVIGTFSKTFAATGGFAATTHEVAQYIRQYGRAYTFSASPAPSTIAAVQEGLRIIQREPALREKLWNNIHYIYKGLQSHGFAVYPGKPESAIMTVVIGPDWKVHQMSRDLYEAGLFTSAVVYPAVPHNRGTLRISLSALHTREDMDTTLSILGEVGKKYELIS